MEIILLNYIFSVTLNISKGASLQKPSTDEINIHYLLANFSMRREFFAM